MCVCVLSTDFDILSEPKINRFITSEVLSQHPRSCFNRPIMTQQHQLLGGVIITFSNTKTCCSLNILHRWCHAAYKLWVLTQQGFPKVGGHPPPPSRPEEGCTGRCEELEMGV